MQRCGFLHVDDQADIAVLLMKRCDSEQFINVGSGKDISKQMLSELIKAAVGYQGLVSNSNAIVR